MPPLELLSFIERLVGTDTLVAQINAQTTTIEVESQEVRDQDRALAEVAAKRIAVAPQRREFEAYDAMRAKFVNELRNLGIKEGVLCDLQLEEARVGLAASAAAAAALAAQLYFRRRRPVDGCSNGSTTEPSSMKICERRRGNRVAAAARARMAGVRIVLENIEDKGNRAAIMRSAEALGLLHVHEVSTDAKPPPCCSAMPTSK